LPWAGDADVQAPGLARLAAEGAVFQRAYSCYARLERARPCLLNGVYPHIATDASSPSLSSVLKGAGYRVAAFGARQAGELVSFAHAPGEQPFFAAWTVTGSGSALLERGSRDAVQLRDNVPLAAQRRAREDLALFTARARTWDREIGVVLSALDRPELARNTIVVFTAYHGEQFGSHGEFGDDAVFEESIRIPLAIRYPGVIRAGTRSEVLVSQVDLLPTLLRWCGVAPPEAAQGRDLSAIMAGQATDRPDSIYAQGRRAQKDEWRMVVQGYDKLAADLEGNVTHLYNLADDPYEMVNLVSASAQQLKRDALLALMRVWMRRLGDGVDASGLKKR
jgi:arylsulfatase A-like enzyme